MKTFLKHRLYSLMKIYQSRTVIVINMFYLIMIFRSFFEDNNFASFNFISQGDNILKDKNSLRSRMINNLNIQVGYCQKMELRIILIIT